MVKNNVIKHTTPRLLLKKLGEISLGDRWDGRISVDGNYLIMGKDTGWFANHPDYSQQQQERRILIDLK